MSEPLNTRTLRHFLDFKSDGTGLIEIDEPIGFDGANFVIEQRSDGYGRDISFAGGETEFTFSAQDNRYGSQFNKLLEYSNIYGFESDVDYILREGSVDYIVGAIDFATNTTDELREFSCAIIQSNQQAILERRSDVKIDLYSTEDLDGNEIAPIQTERILLRAKPVLQESNWKSVLKEERQFISIGGNAFNFCQQIDRFEINDTLTWGLTLNNNIFDFKLIQAQDDLSSIVVSITNLSCRITDLQNNDGSLRLRAVVADNNQTILASYVLDTISSIGSSFNESYTQEVGFIPRGYGFYLAIEQLGDGVIGFISTWNIDISVTATGIDSVTDGIRFIDAVDKTKESIDGSFGLDAPRFKQGGEWYDNFVFSGNMLRGKERFVLDFDMIKGHLPEFHADYEVDNNNIFIGKYDDFYTNNEIGAFLINPNAEFQVSYNERHTINTFNFNYKSFDQDKDNENTIDAIHTETQWLLPNKQVENTKDVEIEFVRDPYLLENTRRKAFTENSSSVQEDDEVFIVDVVDIEIPESGQAFNAFIALLNHQWNGTDSELKLLNDGSFSWLLLGFDVGDDFFVTPKVNSVIDPNEGSYVVSEIERTLLTLTLTGTNLDPQTGEFVTSVTYPLTNVTKVNRTTEGFDLIEGLIEDDKYSNLLYSPKRNILNNYGSYLNTCTKYKSEDIRNTYYKNWTNDDNPLITQFNGGDVINEISNITQDELDDAILTPRIINTKVLCDFSTYRDYASKLKDERGFVRIYDNDNKVLKGFVKSSDFLWAENSLTLTLEEKQDNEITNIYYANDMYYINEVGYPEDIITEIVYKGENDLYIQFFDRYARPLTNKLRFDYVSVDGFTFDSLVELTTAIDELNG